MRCIDADALKDGYMHMGYDPNEHPEESYMEGWCKGFNAAVDHCIGHVIHAPTIDPERKTGRWIEVDDSDSCISGKCSECGWEAHMYEDDVFGMDYCPNCGARLLIEEGEQE